MTKDEWAKHHGFDEETMKIIELALSISEGKITAIFDQSLKYQDIKIKFDKCRI